MPNSSQQANSLRQDTQVDDMSVDDNTEHEDSAKQRTTTRRVANNAPAATLQIRAMHSRVPAWKLSK